MFRARKHLMAAAFALGVSACASGASQSDAMFDGPQQHSPTIKIENGYFEDMVVYLLNGAHRTRLGMVSRLSTSNLTIPSQLLGFGAVRLQATPIGPGKGFTSDRLLIPAGSKVELRLARDLAFSDYAVW